MKKKSPRGIPDFSSKRPNAAQLLKNAKDKPTGAAATAPRVKPPATSAKSGRRGQ